MKSQILILKYLYLKSILNISNRHNSAIFQTTIDMAGRCGEQNSCQEREELQMRSMQTDAFSDSQLAAYEERRERGVKLCMMY